MPFWAGVGGWAHHDNMPFSRRPFDELSFGNFVEFALNRFYYKRQHGVTLIIINIRLGRKKFKKMHDPRVNPYFLGSERSISMRFSTICSSAFLHS